MLELAFASSDYETDLLREGGSRHLMLGCVLFHMSKKNWLVVPSICKGCNLLIVSRLGTGWAFSTMFMNRRGYLIPMAVPGSVGIYFEMLLLSTMLIE